jgi:RHS repeat-associated protein
VEQLEERLPPGSVLAFAAPLGGGLGLLAVDPDQDAAALALIQGPSPSFSGRLAGSEIVVAADVPAGLSHAPPAFSATQAPSSPAAKPLASGVEVPGEDWNADPLGASDPFLAGPMPTRRATAVTSSAGSFAAVGGSGDAQFAGVRAPGSAEAPSQPGGFSAGADSSEMAGTSPAALAVPAPHVAATARLAGRDGPIVHGHGTPPDRPGGPNGTKASCGGFSNCLFYGGDFNGFNGLANEQKTLVTDAHVYDDFHIFYPEVYHITGLFSRNLMDTTATGANVRILGPGYAQAGLVDGGLPQAYQALNLPVTVTPTGFSGFGYTEYQVLVNIPTLDLPPGHYYFDVQPIGNGTGRSFESTTSGANGVGYPINNDDSWFSSSFFGVTWGDAADQVGGSSADFSAGLFGTSTTQGNPPPPPVIPPSSCDSSGSSCGCSGQSGDLVGTAQGVCGSGGGSGFSSNPVRYFDGTVKLSTTDLGSSGFGNSWGQARSWTNNPGYASSGLNGTGNVDIQMPYLLQVSGDNTIAAVSNGTTARYFDSAGGGAYTPRFFDQDQLAHSGSSFVLTDTTGNQLTFNDFTANPPAARGQLIRFSDKDGNQTNVVYDVNGLIQETQRTDPVTGLTESYVYTASAGLLSNVLLRRGPTSSGPWTNVRQVDYAYYGAGQPNGNPGDLKTATIRDGAGAVLDTKYYRYYQPGEANGYAHGLKYLFNPASYARLTAALGGNVDALSDAQVQPYADNYYQYDSQQRVTLEIAQGAGCSSCTGGQGTFTYSYSASSNPDGYNSWKVVTVETLPDGNQNIVYTNAYGEPMLKVFHDTTSNQSWETFYHYDGQGRVDLMAKPSAVTGYDPSKPDLLNLQGGNYQYLSDNAGLVQVTDYYATSTAGESTPGGAAGYVQDEKLQRGELGTPVLQKTVQYFAHTAGGSTVYPVATSTAYRNTDGTGAETTAYAYTWYTGTAQVLSRQTSLPVVASAQNGPNLADVRLDVFDRYGRLGWHMDTADTPDNKPLTYPDRVIRYTEHDLATGAVKKTITDVDTSKASDFQDLPAGWTTGSGHVPLHLVTQYEVDALGRTTMRTDPSDVNTPAHVTYTVYNDANHEVRTYAGWNTATNLPTGPTQVRREDRSNSPSYTETLTMAAVPHVTGGLPDGSEPISAVQTLARTFTSPGGQMVESDAYFNLASLTYGTSPYLGSVGQVQPDGTVTGNYWPTAYAYDSRGRLKRVQAPTGTIKFTVYDGLDRVVTTSVGTTDANLVQVSANQYDGGGVGDGDLTQITEYPGGGAAPRVSQSYYDWRDRRVASKGGVQANEDLNTQRPIVYLDYDNLNQTLAQNLYDGDNVTITFGPDGVPNKPDGSLLRARSKNDFDDQGRIFRTSVFDVKQTDGSYDPSKSLKADNFYDHRGHLIERSNPGGLVTKVVYDGADRRVAQYSTDGGSGTDWAAANTVANDTVLEQTETLYDADGNPLQTTRRQRFHDATAAGGLGDPNTDPKARVSYVASYYDAANRMTTNVNLGTFGGSAFHWTQTVPARSDTALVTNLTYNAAGWVQDTTDPRGLVTRTLYDNLQRKAATIVAYTDGVPTSTTNLTTAFTYDGDGNVLRQTGVLPAGAQTTQYVYAATTAAGSLVNSNDLLTAVKYPDKTTGLPSATNQEYFTYNGLGQALSQRDRNGNLHTYRYDVVGRQTSDAVFGLEGSQTSGSRKAPHTSGQVLRLETAYDTAGRPYLYTSFDATSGGHVLNQVEQLYNGLGQLVTEYQSHSGPVNGSTPAVQYAYSEMAGGNHSRLMSMSYPNGRVVTSNYAAGLDDRTSRLSSLTDSSGTLEAYSYLGLGTVVKRAHPQAGVDLTYIKQTGESNGDAGDPYTGLDRFGRVVDQRWLKPNDVNNPTDRFQYGYDRDGNRQYQDNLAPQGNSFDELYHANGVVDTYDGQGNLITAAYDPLNRLPSFERGTLNASKDTIASPSHTQAWGLDALANWSSVTTDGSTQTRTHNQQNEITSISGQGLTTPAYDANGNTTKDQNGRAYVYDAWNRLVTVRDAGGSVLASYSYDALGRRIIENEGGAKDLYYSTTWQVLEEQVGGFTQAQYVWSPVYVDALVERDQGGQRLYVQQDADWSATAVVDTTGLVQERYAYDPYGKASVLTPNFSPRTNSLFGWTNLHQGGRLDTVTGLYNFRRRDYSPSLGRWMQQDPMRYRDSLNLYQDEKSNPENLVDPTGLLCMDVSRTPISVNLGRDAKQLGIFFVGYEGKVEGQFTVSTCDKCCPNGAAVQDTEIKLAGSVTGLVFGGIGVAINKEAFGFSLFGYAGVKLEGSAKVVIEGSAKTDKCKGVNSPEISICVQVPVQGRLSGGFALSAGVGWFNYDIGAEIFGTATTTAQACVKYSPAKGFSGEWSGFSAPEYRWGFKFCFGPCYTIYMN